MNRHVDRILVLWILGLSSIEAMASESAWTYVLPKPGQELGLTSWRILPMSDDCPADISEPVTYLGQRRSYTQIRYGQSEAARVAMVLDHGNSGTPTFYVDVNRNRKIEPGERQAIRDGLWHVALPISVESEGKRILACRYSRILGSLSAATRGYVEGKVTLGARRISARRVDADANGQFADLQDRIWLDLNADGQWDALSEQFTVSPILTVSSGRYAMKADRLGRSLAFRKLEGTGLLVLMPEVKGKAGQIQSITTSLIGEDGGAFALRGKGSALRVPAGRYRVYSLVLAARSGSRGQLWEYVFNYEGGRPFRWFDLKRDGRVEINPLDEFELVAEGLAETCQPGQILPVSPVLFTADGLRVNSCVLSSTKQDATVAQVVLSDAKGERLSSKKPGFA